jgi:hypothetical protein
MKKLLFISIFFLIVNFVFAQAASVDENVLRQIVDILQKLIQEGQIQPVSPTEAPRHEIKVLETEKKIEQAPGPAEIKVIQPRVIELPRGVMPALPQVIETKPITTEVIRPILPDEDRSDDAIVQINNLRITRILLDPGIQNVKAVFFAVRDIGWKCMLFESEESEKSLPCVLDVRRPILQKELAIQISNDTILLQRNRQRAKLEDFQVGDKINVYGFMDKDNNAIDALIIRNVVSVLKPIFKPTPKPIEPKLPATSTPKVCIQVITPAYNPQNPLECKEFPTPCDVPPGWVKTEKCPVKTPTLQTPTTQTQSLTEAKVEADDYGFYPSSLEFTKGAKVKLYLYVKQNNVYYGGLDFRSEKFKTEPVKPGQKAEVEFIADKDFIIESYWPLSNVKKAELKVVVK